MSRARPGEAISFLIESVKSRDRSSGCWEWPFSKNNNGYGKVRYEGRLVLCHRLSSILAGHARDGDLVVRHDCDNPACFNPGHLSPGTFGDNSQDMVARNRSTRGRRHGGAKLSEEDVIAIRNDPRSAYAIAEERGLSHQHVSAIKAKSKWGWL